MPTAEQHPSFPAEITQTIADGYQDKLSRFGEPSDMSPKEVTAELALEGAGWGALIGGAIPILFQVAKEFSADFGTTFGANAYSNLTAQQSELDFHRVALLGAIGLFVGTGVRLFDYWRRGRNAKQLEAQMEAFDEDLARQQEGAFSEEQTITASHHPEGSSEISS